MRKRETERERERERETDTETENSFFTVPKREAEQIDVIMTQLTCNQALSEGKLASGSVYRCKSHTHTPCLGVSMLQVAHTHPVLVYQYSKDGFDSQWAGEVGLDA